MRRAIGPIVTTGVAIVVAGVVVANPIVAPRADVAIPAVKLSGSSDATGSMLDQAFLDAIAPGPSDSTNPFSVLKQLFTSLASDATTLGKNAIVNAFVAGVTAVSEPELTAASLPYVSDGVAGAAVAPPPDFGGLAALAQTAGIDPAAIVNGSVSGIVAAVDPSHITNTIGTAVDQLASSIVSDAGYVGHELIAAAFAAGAVVASEPAMIAATLKSLVKGDIAGALQSVVAAATAPFGPTGMVIDAFVNVFESHLTQLTTGLPTANIPTSVVSSPLVSSPLVSAASPLATVTAPAVAGRGQRSTVTPAAEPAITASPVDTPADTTAVKPVVSVDLPALTRSVSGQTDQTRAADTAAGDSPSTTDVAPAPAPRTVARDSSKQGRDTARGAAARAARGASAN